MTRQEIPNNTPAQIRDYLQQALALIEDLDIPDHLEAVAFEQAIQLYAGKQIVMVQPQPLDLSRVAIPGGRH